MRLVIAAGFSVAFTGCVAEEQTTGEKPDEGVPQRRQETTDAAAPGPVITLQSQKGWGTLLTFDVGPPVTRTNNDGNPENREPGSEIVTLLSRNGRVTVYASEVGPLFTITTNDGTVEARHLSYVELQDRYPDHYRAFRNSIAVDGRMYAGYYRAFAIEDGSVKLRAVDVSR